MRYVKPCVSSVKVPLRTAGYNRHLGRNRFISTKQKWFHSTFFSLVWLKQPTLSRVISSTILLLGFNVSTIVNVSLMCSQFSWIQLLENGFRFQKWELLDIIIILSSSSWVVCSRHFIKHIFVLTTGIIKVVGIEGFFIQTTYCTTVLLEG